MLLAGWTREPFSGSRTSLGAFLGTAAATTTVTRHLFTLSPTLRQQQRLWAEGRPCMNNWEWWDLLRKVDENWTEVERLSLESGHAFKDRYGVWRNQEALEDRSLVTQTLKAWCAYSGLDYS